MIANYLITHSFASLIMAVIALLATAVIAVALRPKSPKEKHHPSK